MSFYICLALWNFRPAISPVTASYRQLRLYCSRLRKLLQVNLNKQGSSVPKQRTTTRVSPHPIASCLLPLASCLLPLASCLLPLASCLLPLAFCSLFPVPCSLFPVPCSLFPIAYPPNARTARQTFPPIKAAAPSSNGHSGISSGNACPWAIAV